MSDRPPTSAGRTVLVLTNDAGLGHRQAALAVVAALERRYGDLCRAVLVNPLEEPGAPALLRDSQSDFNRVIRFAPALYRYGHWLANTTLPTRLMEQLQVVTLDETMARVLARERPDVVVTTHPAFVYLLANLRRREGQTWPLVVLVTDLARLQRLWFRREVDLYLVPTDEAAALAFADELGLTFPVALDRTGETGRQYELRAMPTTFFVDRRGVIRSVVVGGPMSEALIRSRVEELLAEAP